MGQSVMKKRVVLISNDRTVYRSIRESMQDDQIDVYLIPAQSEETTHAVEQECSLIILDLHQIGASGVDILRVIQPVRLAPILALIEKSSPTEKAALLYAGVDVCLEKTTDTSVLVAQANALIRLFAEISKGHTQCAFLSFGSELVINPQYRQVIIDGNSLTLTRKEFELLHFLANNPWQVLSREQLYQNVWHGSLEFGGDGTVKAHISTLRKKLEAVGKHYIENIWGVGYKFIPPCSKSIERHIPFNERDTS